MIGELLGLQIGAARRERKMTQAELAARVGISVGTLRKIEKGDLTVALGPIAECLTVLRQPVFGEDLRDVDGRFGLDIPRRLLEQRLHLLPSRVARTPEPPVDDDF
ncbi:helix-turn-helix domain-containing protein [Leifsonia sp. L25]|uniref:helix-turn-helix domain-containing protein n=1 Tax=Actinomycetes TaxID=1760 RepID=UPI003D685A77